MSTYDYYKNQETHILFSQSKLFVENGHVMIETYNDDPNGFPHQLNKGVWSVKNILGGVQYVPEGDPEYDANAEQLVWGKTIAPRAVCDGTEENDHYTRKLIEASRTYWANK